MTKELKGKAPEFSGLRAALWPIHSYELKKFLPMGLMMFCALFNYTIVRDVKDALVVTAAGSETISFVKFWVVLPLAVLFVAIYSKMANTFSKEKLFYYSLLPFLTFFGCFGFIFYPAKDFLMPNADTVDAAIAAAPVMRWFIMLWAKWVYVIFYAFAELWGSVVVSLLFWQFANQITRVFEAKRYYAMFGIIGNLGLILSGYTLKMLTKYGKSVVGEGGNPFDVSIQYIMGAFLIFGLLFMYLYGWTNKNVMSDPRLYDPSEVKAAKKKEKLSLAESAKLVFSSRYLLLIFTLIMGYGICINLVEVTWKGQIGKAFPNSNDYTDFMGSFSMYTGFVTIFFMFVGANIVRIFGWRVAAILTPLMILVTSAIFFGNVLFQDMMTGVLAFFSTTPLMMAVIVGMIQNILSKATKYSLFDSTKEMAYIPLSDELKTKGKAAVDVIGGRFSKSGGSMIQMFLLMTVAAGAANGQEIIAPYLFGFLCVIIALWIMAVLSLSVRFNDMSRKRDEENAAKDAKTA